MPSGHPLSDEIKDNLVKIVKDEIEKHQRKEVDRFTTNFELMSEFKICRASVSHVLRDYLPKNSIEYRMSKIRSQTLKALYQNPEFREVNQRRLEVYNSNPENRKKASERMQALNQDPVFAENNKIRARKTMQALNQDPNFRAANKEAIHQLYQDPIFLAAAKERAKINGSKSNQNPEFREANRKRAGERMRRLHQDPAFRKKLRDSIKRLHQDPNYISLLSERSRISMTMMQSTPENRKKASERMRRLHQDPAFRKANKQRAIKNSDELSKNSYFVESRFYSYSQQEGSVALLLEKYLTNFIIIDGINFQVKKGEINNGGIDFFVNGEFLEWHPIYLYFGKRGDIPSQEELNQFKATLELLVEEEKKEFEQQYKEILSINYLNKRQTDVDNSEYNVSRVYLVRDVEELYEFMQRHTDSLPSLDEFKREFRQKIKYVKGFKVDRTAKPA